MNNIKKQIINNINPYLEFGEHKDLIAFAVASEMFEEPESYGIANFNELIVVTEKNWLFHYMTDCGIHNPREYLINEYTSDDGYEWFIEANEANKIVTTEFN